MDTSLENYSVAHTSLDQKGECWTWNHSAIQTISSGGFRGGRTLRAPPWPKIFSVSCSFSENLTKSYVGAP